jgi:hypothetical protein
LERQRAAESASTPKSGCAMPTHTASLPSIGLRLRAIWEVPVSDDIANVLARHKGTLHLDGLTDLSEAAAEALSNFDGWLTLGMTQISEGAAAALAKGNTSLKLIKLEQINGTAGHIALAKKLVADGTNDILYYLKDVAPELVEAVPEFGKK